MAPVVGQTGVTLHALQDICQRMREVDKVEIYGMMPHDSWYVLSWDAYALITNKGRGRVAWWQGRPAGLCAFTEMHPGVWNAWMFGTDDFRNVVVDLVRWGRREVRDILAVSRGHRCQCDSRAGHDQAHRLLKALGARQEGPPMKGYGKDGSDYLRFVWLRETDSAVLEPGFVRAG
jgi:hypothetical protein